MDKQTVMIIALCIWAIPGCMFFYYQHKSNPGLLKKDFLEDPFGTVIVMLTIGFFILMFGPVLRYYQWLDSRGPGE